MSEEIMNEYEDLDNTVVLCDEDGNDVTMQFLDSVEYEGKDYIVLLPPETDGVYELVILEVVEEGDDEVYMGIEDDAVADAVFAIFKERYEDIMNFTQD